MRTGNEHSNELNEDINLENYKYSHKAKHKGNAFMYVPLPILLTPCLPGLSTCSASRAQTCQSLLPFWLLQLDFFSWHHQLTQPSQAGINSLLWHELHHTCHSGSSTGLARSMEGGSGFSSSCQWGPISLPESMEELTLMGQTLSHEEKRGTSEQINFHHSSVWLVQVSEAPLASWKVSCVSRQAAISHEAEHSLPPCICFPPSLFHFSFSLTIASLGLNPLIKHQFHKLYLRFCFLENWARTKVKVTLKRKDT